MTASAGLTTLSRLLSRAQELIESALEAQSRAQRSLEAARDALAEGRTHEAERHIDAALAMLRSRSVFG